MTAETDGAVVVKRATNDCFNQSGTGLPELSWNEDRDGSNKQCCRETSLLHLLKRRQGSSLFAVIICPMHLATLDR